MRSLAMLILMLVATMAPNARSVMTPHQRPRVSAANYSRMAHNDLRLPLPISAAVVALVAA